MRFERANTRTQTTTKRPFIVPLMEYIFGIVIIILAIWLTLKIFENPNDDGVIGIFASILLITFIAGFGVLLIVVGFKRRKWQ